MNKLREKLDHYLLQNPDEKDTVLRFQKLLDDPEDPFFRTRLAGHITASSFVLNKDKTHTLFILHKKLQKWLQPGGHADGDRDTLAVAQKEVWEETGLETHPFSQNIFDLDIHTIPERKNEPEHFHFDIRYALVAKEDNLKSNHEVMACEWFALDNLPIEKLDPSVRRMADRWQSGKFR